MGKIKIKRIYEQQMMVTGFWLIDFGLVAFPKRMQISMNGIRKLPLQLN